MDGKRELKLLQKKWYGNVGIAGPRLGLKPISADVPGSLIDSKLAQLDIDKQEGNPFLRRATDVSEKTPKLPLQQRISRTCS